MIDEVNDKEIWGNTNDSIQGDRVLNLINKEEYSRQNNWMINWLIDFGAMSIDHNWVIDIISNCIHYIIDNIINNISNNKTSNRIRNIIIEFIIKLIVKLKAESIIVSMHII